jgi:MFS family permease
MKIFSQYKGLKKEIYVLFFGRMVTAMGSFVYPMLTFMLKIKLNFTPSQIAIFLAISTLVSLPASIIGGKLTDKIGRKKIIVFFDLITATLFIAAGLLPFSMVTLVIIFVGSLFQTMKGPAFQALVADFSAPQDREKAFSLSYLGFNLGFMIGPALGGLLFANYFGLSFIINALCTLISTILIMKFVFEKNAIKNSSENLSQSLGSEYELADESTSTWTIIKSRKIILGVMIAGSLSGAVYGLVGFLLPLNLESLYINQGAVIYGTLCSFNGFVVIAATPLMMMISRKLKEIPKMLIGVLLFVAGLAIFGFTTGLVLTFAGMMVYTVGEVVNTLGGSPYITRRIPASHRGRIFAVSSIAGTAIAIISQLTIGFLLERYDYSFLWSIYIAVGFVVVLMLLVLYRLDKATFPKLYLHPEGFVEPTTDRA